MADEQTTPISRSQDDDFTIEYYEDGRYRLCLDTSNPDKLPRFRQAIDCIEKILKLRDISVDTPATSMEIGPMPSDLPNTTTCCNCEKDCSGHYWMCDEDDGEFCPDCWEKTACSTGVHGEGCPTQVFSND